MKGPFTKYWTVLPSKMYGSSRPKEVMPIQEQSAMRNHLAKDKS